MNRKLTEVETKILKRLRSELRRAPAPVIAPSDEDHVVREVLRLSTELFSAPVPLNHLVGPVVTTPFLTEWLRISRQGAGKAVKQHRILGVQIGRKWFYPSWQLQVDHLINPAVHRIALCLPEDYSSLHRALWFHQENGMLSGYRPCRLIHDPKNLHRLERAALQASSAEDLPTITLPSEISGFPSE